MITIKEQDKAMKEYHPNMLGSLCWYDDDGRLVRTYDPSHGNDYYKYEKVFFAGEEMERRVYCTREEYIKINNL